MILKIKPIVKIPKPIYVYTCEFWVFFIESLLEDNQSYFNGVYWEINLQVIF